jgi:hypothetical protein
VAVDPEVIAAVTMPTSLAAIVLGVGHYWTKLRIAHRTPSADVEKRLARLEVAIDDMTAELSRVAEGQQFMNKLLSDRSAEEHRAAR